MADLTKILKVGDKVESYRYGEGEVSEIKTPSCNAHYCIQVILPNGVNTQWYLSDGRLSQKSLRPDLLPLGMEIPPPQWPEVPKLFEWEGEIYTEGEWVAVRVGVNNAYKFIAPYKMPQPLGILRNAQTCIIQSAGRKRIIFNTIKNSKL